jgi:hypothetical protein
LLASGNPNMVNCICQPHEFDSQLTARVLKTRPHPCNAEGLAWRAADQYVWSRYGAGQYLGGDLGHVAQVRDIWVVVSQDSSREGFNLSQPCSAISKRMPGDGCCLDAGTN